MDKTAKVSIGIIGVFVLIISLLTFQVLASECSSQDCNVGASLTLGNTAPTLDSVLTGVTVTLTGLSTANTQVNFTASDINGVADLNDSSAQCIGYKTGESLRTSSSCTANDQDADTTTYNCSVTFHYYDAAAADWKWNCSISDLGGPSADYNDTETFIINALNYVDQNITQFSWSTASSSTNDQEADTPLVLSNGGNQDYETCSVTGQNATSGANTITTSSFAVNASTSSPVGTGLVDNTSVAITSWFTLPHGSGSTETIYAYVDIGVVPTGTYTSTSDWLIDITS